MKKERFFFGDKVSQDGLELTLQPKLTLNLQLFLP